MSQYNKLSDIQYARFHILHVDLHFETVLVSWYPHHELYLCQYEVPGVEPRNRFEHWWVNCSYNNTITVWWAVWGDHWDHHKLSDLHIQLTILWWFYYNISATSLQPHISIAHQIYLGQLTNMPHVMTVWHGFKAYLVA